MSEDRRTPLDSHRWERVRTLFDRCLASPPAERDRLLSEAELWLRTEVESLLHSGSERSDFLESPLLPRLADGSSDLPRWAGKYLLVRRLGRGGMAEVFLARVAGAAGFVRWMAAKRILGDLSRDPELLALFQQEARLIASLNHANIVHVYDFEETEGGYLLLMEYVNGHTLAEILKKGNLPAELALFIGTKIASAVEYAHERGILHRDLSPRNVMVSYDGEVKVLDFGISRHQERVTSTQSGKLKGTPGYLPPEAIKGAKSDVRSEVFSIAVLLFEALSGKKLFDAPDTLSLLHQLDGYRTPELAFDPTTNEILRKGLERDPAARYASVSELRLELERKLSPGAQAALARHLRESFANEQTARQRVLESEYETAPRPPRRKRGRLGLALAGIAALVVASGVAVRRFRETTAPGVCAAEQAKFCPGEEPRHGELGFCLKRFEAELSPGCRKKLSELPLVATCGDDAIKYCDGLRGPAMRRCLASDRERLSPRCRSAIR